MEQIRSALDTLQEINRFHELSNEPIATLLDEMKSSKVSTPFIGKFSAGKSALINALLGYSKPILKEAITPETAVPTEISYGIEDSVQVVTVDHSIQEMDIATFRTTEFDAAQMNRIQLTLRNEQLMANIPDVMLVDMPGFESGNEIHNQAIDRYLPDSLVYCIAFPADDMTLKASMKTFLLELDLHQMPICIVITKQDKVSEDILQANLAKLHGDISLCIRDQNRITTCITSSKKGDIKDLKHYLFDIQEQSQQLLASKFRQAALHEADQTAAYLTTIIQNQTLSLPELEEREDELVHELQSLTKHVNKDQEDFNTQIPSIIQNIIADVRSSLQQAEETFIVMILNNQEIVDKVNQIVRESLTRSMQQRFTPKVQQYVKHLSTHIQVDLFSDMGLSINLDTDRISTKIINGAVAGISLVVLGPLLTVIGAVLSYFITTSMQNKKREENKAKIKQKLASEVYPEVVNQIRLSLDVELRQQVQNLNESITEQINRQREVLEKALAELRVQLTKEQLSKEQVLVRAKEDLHRIEVLKHDI